MSAPDGPQSQAALLEKAIALAVTAHAGQRDRYERPYILHPLHLMLQMNDDTEMMVAVLHDVLEDTDLKAADLRDAGLPAAVVDAVQLLTHDKETASYEEYVAGLKRNALARRVKLADLQHNMDLRRLPDLTERDRQRLSRYHQAWKSLQSADEA